MNTFYKIILLCAINLISFHVSAQWNQVGYMIVNGNDTVNGSHVIKGFGTNLFCGTTKGLFKSTDNGDNWTNISFNATVISGQDIFSVFQASNSNLFAGSNKRMFKSTDNGSTWTWLSALPDSATYNDIAEIGGNILVSYNKGTSNGMYYSNDFGTTWTASTGISSGVKYFLIEGSNILIGGTSNGVYKSIDAGQTWSILGTGIPANSGIWDIKRTGNKLLANSVTGAGLFESIDNGSNWTVSNPTVFNGFCQVFSMAQSGSTIVLTNDGSLCNPSGNAAIRMSTDGGTTWSAFLGGTTIPSFYSVVGRNASGSSFFTKKGNGKETYRYNNSSNHIVIDPQKPNRFLEIDPNPTCEKIKIQPSNSMGGTSISLMNSAGQIIEHHTIYGQSIELNVSNLSNGFYIVEWNENGNTIRGKFLKD